MMAKRNKDDVERNPGTDVNHLRNDFKGMLQNEARRSDILRNSTEDQLKNISHFILKLKAIGTASQRHSSSTSVSSSPSTGSIIVDEDAAGYHLPTAKELDDLRNIAGRMNSRESLEKLISLYVSERKAFMNAELKRLGIEKSSNIEVQRMGLEPLRLKTMRWTRAANISLQILFPREKQISEHIFKGLGNAAEESCLVEVLRDPAAQLLDFAESVSISRPSPEKLESILLLYKGLSARIRNMNPSFPPELENPIKVRASSILSRLDDTVKLLLFDFEDALVREQSSAPAPGGTVHRLTRYVMGYIGMILDNKDILEKSITAKPSMTLGDSNVSDLERILDLDGRTPLAIHVFWIIVTLRQKLEGLSKNYQDAPLANLFLMNNTYYMVDKIKLSATLRATIGEIYSKKLTENIELATTSYLRTTWDRVLDSLRSGGVRGSGIFSSGVSGRVVKKRLKKFNLLIADVHRDQVMWAVPDPELKEKLFQSILEKLLPSYRSFLQQFSGHVESRYIKYTEEDLETIVRGLFCVS